MNCFCTIIDPHFLPQAKTLLTSLQRYLPDTQLHLLIISEPITIQSKNPDGIVIYNVDNLKTTKGFDILMQKYKEEPNRLRWSLKPIFLQFLLQQFEKIIFTDPDIYFTASPDFLFSRLDDSNMLLTPHWGGIDPWEDENNFLMNFQLGIYNAGFIGVNKQSVPALQWWANSCSYAMQRNPAKGLFDDQRYLDMIPVLFDNIQVVKHQGCNVGSWNIGSCKRSMKGNTVVINNQYPVIFIHFNKETILQILNQNDSLLRPYYDTYILELGKNELQATDFPDHYAPKEYDSLPYKIKHKVRLRTRIKTMLYKLAAKF